jgi:hypothetical protein
MSVCFYCRYSSSISESENTMAHASPKPCPRVLPDGSVCGSLQLRPRGNCAACHRRAAAAYRARKAAAAGSHTKTEWLNHAATFSCCPVCNRPWDKVERPNSQRLPFTKGHIVALTQGGSNGIENLRPECARCNYGGPGVGFRAKAS